jgi:hypothetical protein
MQPHYLDAAERAALWANQAFQAALEAGRASVARAARRTLEELDRETPLTPEEVAEADAWLDEYERRLDQEARG